MGGKFFYAVIQADENGSFGNIGIDGAEVYAIHYCDSAMVVSDYDGIEIKMLRKNLLPYQMVLKKAGDCYTTLPAKFGQLASDEGEITRLLRCNYPLIKRELNRLYNKKEFSIILRWKGDDFIRHLVSTDHGLMEVATRLFNKPSKPTGLEQIELGRMVRHSMDIFKDKTAKKIVAALRNIISDYHLQEPPEETIIISGPFLVHGEHYGEFKEALSKIADQIGGNYELETSGPWAPFSFVEELKLF